MEVFLPYVLRVAPGIVVIALAYIFLPRKEIVARLFLLMFGFILMRDAMTPMGFWRLGISEHTLWIRFTDDGLILLILGAMWLLLSLGVYAANRPLRSYVMWFGANTMKSIGAGLAGAGVLLAPFYFMYLSVPMAQRGGSVSPTLLPFIFCIAFLGNFMEEVLFRGFLQGYLEEAVGATRAVLLSALLFAIGHGFLATTVTNLGVGLLLFTLFEGLVCAVVRRSYGVIPATIAHGMTIFLLASGLI